MNMTEQEAIIVLVNKQNLLIKNQDKYIQEEYEEYLTALDVALVALRRGDTLAISHGWTKENIEAASLGVTTRTPGDWQIYSMKEKKWLE